MIPLGILASFGLVTLAVAAGVTLAHWNERRAARAAWVKLEAMAMKEARELQDQRDRARIEEARKELSLVRKTRAN